MLSVCYIDRLDFFFGFLLLILDQAFFSLHVLDQARNIRGTLINVLEVVFCELRCKSVEVDVSDVVGKVSSIGDFVYL